MEINLLKAWFIFTIGVAFDLLTTATGFLIFNLSEFNIIGIEGVLILNVIILIGVYYGYKKTPPKKYIRSLTIALTMMGIFRAFIGLWNIILIIKILL